MPQFQIPGAAEAVDQDDNPGVGNVEIVEQLTDHPRHQRVQLGAGDRLTGRLTVDTDAVLQRPGGHVEGGAVRAGWGAGALSHRQRA